MNTSLQQTRAVPTTINPECIFRKIASSGICFRSGGKSKEFVFDENAWMMRVGVECQYPPRLSECRFVRSQPKRLVDSATK